MNLPAPVSCPACEYASGSPGKPAAAGSGRMRCLACGAQWREMGASHPLPVATGRFEAQSFAPPAPARAAFRISNAMVWASAALAIFLAGALPLSHLASRGGEPGLEITALSARQMVREGQVAVRIEGRITNRTASRQIVRSVDVVLTGGEGRVYGWTHKPAVPWLEPGQSIRFATANGNVPRAADRAEVSSAGVTAEVSL